MVNLDESTNEIEDDSKQTWSEAFNPSDNDYEADQEHREAPNTEYRGERNNAISRFYYADRQNRKMSTLNFVDKFTGKVYMINAIEVNPEVTILDIYVGDIDAKDIIQNVKWIDTIRLGPDPQEQY